MRGGARGRARTSRFLARRVERSPQKKAAFPIPAGRRGIRSCLPGPFYTRKISQFDT